MYDKYYGASKLSRYINDMDLSVEEKLAVKEATAGDKEEFKDTLKDLDIWDVYIEYMNENELKPSDLNLTKKLVSEG